MGERLHYFTEASTPVAFDLEDSDIDSIEDSAKRPTSDAERAKQHATTLQLWSDEARRRRGVMSPVQRRPSSTSLHDAPILSNAAFFPVALDERAFRASMDRQPSNLSDRSRNPVGSLRLSRSSSGKNLRIRITPTSSTKSLTSDIDSDTSTMPNSPHRTIIHPSKQSVGASPIVAKEVQQRLDNSRAESKLQSVSMGAGFPELSSRDTKGSYQRESISLAGAGSLRSGERRNDVPQLRDYHGRLQPDPESARTNRRRSFRRAQLPWFFGKTWRKFLRPRHSQ